MSDSGPLNGGTMLLVGGGLCLVAVAIVVGFVLFARRYRRAGRSSADDLYAAPPRDYLPYGYGAPPPDHPHPGYGPPAPAAPPMPAAAAPERVALPPTYAAPPPTSAAPAPILAGPPPVTGRAPVPVPPQRGPEERLCFTAAYPPEVVADSWHTLLMVLHTSGAKARVEEVLRSRAAELGGEPAFSSTAASTPMRRGTMLTLVPTVKGVEFNPAKVDVAWHEDVQESTFRLRTAAPPGTGLYGAVEVFVGPLLVAVVPIGLRVAEATVAAPVRARGTTSQAAILDRIFVSYSRRDTAVVDACTAVYRALGVQVLMDTVDLRSGQDWRESLHSLIKQADLFQLYWSSAAAASSEVEHEWRYARTLADKGSGFIRPLFWESPMPEPPPELGNVHFSRVELAQIANLQRA